MATLEARVLGCAPRLRGGYLLQFAEIDGSPRLVPSPTPREPDSWVTVERLPDGSFRLAEGAV